MPRIRGHGEIIVEKPVEYDLPKEVYGAIRVIKDWQPEGKWNQRMRRKGLKSLLRITIYGTRSRE